MCIGGRDISSCGQIVGARTYDMKTQPEWTDWTNITQDHIYIPFCTTGTESFLGVKTAGAWHLKKHPYPAPKLKKV